MELRGCTGMDGVSVQIVTQLHGPEPQMFGVSNSINFI